MMDEFSPNDGTRPSRLVLDRYAVGELSGAERAAVEKALEDWPEGRRHLAELAEIQETLPPVDVAALRLRAAIPEQHPEAANRSMTDTAQAATLGTRNAARWPLALLAAAVALLLAVPIIGFQLSGTEPGVRVRGSATLSLFVLENGLLRPYSGQALSSGAVVGFRAVGIEGPSALASLDARGVVSPLWQGTVETDGSIAVTATLDATPGTERFVLAAGADTARLTAELRAAHDAGDLELGDFRSSWPHPVATAAVQKR